MHQPIEPTQVSNMAVKSRLWPRECRVICASSSLSLYELHFNDRLEYFVRQRKEGKAINFASNQNEADHVAI